MPAKGVMDQPDQRRDPIRQRCLSASRRVRPETCPA
jgi:hypothetical protein